jgi:hypothetical protein
MSWLDDLFAQQNGGILNGMYPSPLPGEAQPPQAGSVFQAGAAPFGFAGLAAKTPPQAAFPPAGGNGASAWTQPTFAAPAASAPAIAMALGQTPADFGTYGAQNYAPFSLAGPAVWQNVGQSQQAAPSTPDSVSIPTGMARSFANAVPVLGPYNNKIEAGLEAGAAPVVNRLFKPENPLNEPTWGGRSEHALRVQNAIDARFAKEYPKLAMASAIAANMGAFGLLGKTAMGARMLGLTEGPLAEKMLQGAITHTAVGGVDAVARGKTDGWHLLAGAVGGAARPVGRQAIQALNPVFNFIPYLHRLP